MTSCQEELEIPGDIRRGQWDYPQERWGSIRTTTYHHHYCRSFQYNPANSAKKKNSKKSGSISLSIKALFDPLSDELSQIWERCCDLTLVGRSTNDYLFSLLYPPSSMFASITRSHPRSSPVSLIGAGKVVPADKKQLGFGSLCFGFREDNNRKGMFTMT